MPISRVKSVKIYTGQKFFTRAPPVAPVTNIRYAADLLPSKVGAVDGDGDGAVNSLGLADCVGVDDCAPNTQKSATIWIGL